CIPRDEISLRRDRTADQVLRGVFDGNTGAVSRRERPAHVGADKVAAQRVITAASESDPVAAEAIYYEAANNTCVTKAAATVNYESVDRSGERTVKLDC